MNERKFYEILERHGFEDNVTGIYDEYNGATTDARIIILSYYGLDKREGLFTRFIERVCRMYDYEWQYDDSVYVDYDDDCAYDIGYGEADILFEECEYIGRRQFEKGDKTFDDVAGSYVNNPDKALPSWLEPTDGWEERSCDFASGWYGRNDSPTEIAEKLYEKDLDVIFQIGSVSMFEVQFCVWTKEQ